MKRRSLFKVGAVSAFAISSTAAHALTLNPSQKWDGEYDVIIVGAGGAGLGCAIETTDRKLKTLILEKMPFVGGASAICGGQYSAANTPYQIERGIKDDDEHFLKNMLDIGGHVNDPELVKAYIKEALSHFIWLSDHGVHPSMVYAPSGMDVPRAHRFDPAEVVKCMQKYVTDNGAVIMTSTKGERLICDPQTNQICGVKASSKGKDLYFKANKGVLLSAGGFCHNPAMLNRYVPMMKLAAVVAAPGATGDGINMALEYGADTLDTGYVRASFGYKPNPRHINDFSLIQFSGAILLNKNGQRFAKESLSYKELGNPTLDQPEGLGYAVFDDSIREKAMKSWVGDKVLLEGSDGPNPRAHVFVGKNFADAAAKARLPVEVALKTVEKYNSDIQSKGVDSEFGRDSLSSCYGKPVVIPVDKRIYIMPLTSGLMSTCAGVRITPKAEVINIFGEKIPHLYAAGEMTGGIHGSAYMTGTAFAKAMCYGRIAGRAIAEN